MSSQGVVQEERGWPVLGTQPRGQLPDEVWKEIRALHTVRPWRSVFLYLLVYASIAAAFVLEAQVSHPLFTALMVVFIAGRQHSLYILNHDASHHILFRTRFANKLAGTLLSNLTMFHHPEAWSYVQWQRVHVLHHMHLFTADDPNYVGRQVRGDTQNHYSVARLVWTCLKNGLLTFTQFFWGRQDYVPPKSRVAHKWRDNHLRTLLLPFREDPELEQERRIKLVFFALVLVGVGYFNLWRPFLLLWILPMYTVYPIILTLMDLTEHRWTEGSEDLNRNTRSTRLGLLTRLFISGLPRTFHREHHVFPGVPVVGLPRVNELLCQAHVTPAPAQGLPALFKELSETAARVQVQELPSTPPNA